MWKGNIHGSTSKADIGYLVDNKFIGTSTQKAKIQGYTDVWNT